MFFVTPAECPPIEYYIQSEDCNRFVFKLNCLEDRAHACAGLANLVLETNAIPSLMRHEIVRRVAPLILDEDEKIQEAATGVLRYMVFMSFYPVKYENGSNWQEIAL